MDATWAPDGASVAFLGGPLDGASDPGVFVATADGTNETRLADASENLQWTPDSEALLYGMGPIGVHQVSADGNKRGLLLGDVWWDGGELSPDGRLVAATARYPNPDGVIVVELAGSEREEYSAGPGTYEETRWSPAGRYLAFLRKPRVPGQVDDDFKRDVYVLDTATGSLQNVTNTPEGSEGYLSWSPDGEWLVYNVYRDGIWTVRRDGTDARRLVRIGWQQPCLPITRWQVPRCGERRAIAGMDRERRRVRHADSQHGCGVSLYKRRPCLETVAQFEVKKSLPS